ncbi:MAG: TetR/AcrR family transcriptional regulator [Candidatus Devosia euplotis]|nr:TetR/AcrR family transcriptional regulator [Candidatus Devosia euplotis]
MNAERDTGIPVQERIIHAATRLFAEKGYAGTSTAEIVAAAGVTKPMVYYYFGDKEGLFRAVMEQVNRRLRDGFLAIEARGLGAREALVAVAELMFAATRESPTESRLQFASYYGPGEGEASKILELGPTTTHEAIQKIVQMGVAQGVLRGDPFQIACAVQGTLNLYIMAHLARPETVTLSEGFGRQVIALLVAGIGAS